MLTLIRACSIAALLLPGAAAVAAAQETKPGAPPPPPATKLSLDFGLVNTTGNTTLTTVNLGEKFEWTPQSAWSFTEGLTIVEGSENGAQTAEHIKGLAQPRYNVSSLVGAYALAGYERDRFNGLAWRWEEGVGVTVQAVKDAHNELKFEGGVSLNQQQDYVTAAVERRDFASTRTFVSYKYLFAEKSYAYQTLEWLANLEDGADQRVNTETGLVAPVVAAVAIKVTYTVRYDHQPVQGYLSTDRTLTTGIQITF